MKSVWRKQDGQKFSSLEITKVVSKRFLGIPFLSVTAHSRHIQPGIALVPAKDFVFRKPVAAPPESGLDSGGKRLRAEVAIKEPVAEGASRAKGAAIEDFRTA